MAGASKFSRRGRREIGDVEDLTVNEDGTLLSVIAEDEMDEGEFGEAGINARLNYGQVSDVIVQGRQIAAVMVDPAGFCGPG